MLDGPDFIPSNDALAAEGDAEWFEYSKAANPIRPSLTPPIPYHEFTPALHASGPTRLIPLDIAQDLRCEGPATSPGLCANFARILPNETLTPDIAAEAATSLVFYVIHGNGATIAASGETICHWGEGDLVALPGGVAYAHMAGADGATLYLVHDAPLLRHLGVSVSQPRFAATLYPAATTRKLLQQVADDPGATGRNRISMLLGNTHFPRQRTITHVIWAMYGIVQPGSVQRPHRHQSVALDFIVSCGAGCYTLVGKELDREGNIINPARQDWASGIVFVTPPGYWHAHYNEGAEPSYVLPLQDAGLQTYLRTLDIRFA